MKRFLFILIIIISSTLTSTGLRAQTLCDIERHGSWYYLYDENSRHYHTLTVSTVGDIVGWSSTFIVAEKGSWIYLYDTNGRRYRTLTKSTVGDIISVAGNRFTSRKGSWVYTYDSTGKRLSTRTAR